MFWAGFSGEQFPGDRFSVLNPFAVLLRYEETPYISMSGKEMDSLAELAYQWADGVITA